MQEEVRVGRYTHLAEQRGGVGTDPHTVCTLGSCCRSCSQHGLWHEVLRRRREYSEPGALAQQRGEGSPAPGSSHNKPAPEVSNVVKLQPADINNLQFMMW